MPKAAGEMLKSLRKGLSSETISTMTKAPDAPSAPVIKRWNMKLREPRNALNKIMKLPPISMTIQTIGGTVGSTAARRPWRAVPEISQLGEKLSDEGVTVWCRGPKLAYLGVQAQEQRLTTEADRAMGLRRPLCFDDGTDVVVDLGDEGGCFGWRQPSGQPAHFRDRAGFRKGVSPGLVETFPCQHGNECE